MWFIYCQPNQTYYAISKVKMNSSPLIGRKTEIDDSWNQLTENPEEKLKVYQQARGKSWQRLSEDEQKTTLS